jgi:hypothetical protein
MHLSDLAATGSVLINADTARNDSRLMQWCTPSNADTRDDLNLLDLTANAYLDNKRWMRMSLSHPPKAGDYSSPAPSDGSSAASIFKSRFMLLA